MQFSDLALSKRLERAEGFACAQRAVARRLQSAAVNAEWIECDGAYAVFDGVDSPCTQTFGLGIFEELTSATLDTIEAFFARHEAPVFHEVSPFAGPAALALLCQRGYRPMEITSVLYLPVAQATSITPANLSVRVINPDEATLWSEVSTRGWVQDHPEFADLFLDLGAVIAASEHTVCFLAEIDGQPGAAGVLCLHDGVALFGGAATVPEFRRRGLQAALLQARMRYAFEHQCDLAMMCALPGSESQRNAERKGFRIAYTRTKWQLQN
jgi:GNAT superfamily N-acetyltransferase